VNADPAALLRLYEEVGQVPDIWNLTEWSDWLLPAYRERAGQRYVNAPVKKDSVALITNKIKFSSYMEKYLRISSYTVLGSPSSYT
jgi:hypothetical protein